ncbi:DUF1624 domain-containing protein [Leptothrix discophora]|uniref:Heparan-alpha-glucosaminide N-acetyltransferase n=1 Tax=Leptothrix discophora TaxID=89 RepID=A0ABT9FZD4_LEPDI|nr:heparan-alpha-glucosaminide N-acetyltransferase [Leptothrix discophora]MDP4299590.1 heparan-alpha-glucosaminide N-acetyltransferase [Leptothrix discophora]
MRARPVPIPPAGLERHDRLDALRGLAMVWMTVFHASFDLNNFRLIAPQDFYRDPFWTGQRLVIVSIFLACAGASQAVAHRQGVSWPRFWRRWAQIAGGALAVSLGSWWMFPNSWISFGVLHAMAVMALLVRLLAPLGTPALVALAGLALVAPQVLSDPFFDSRWTNWVGLVTHKPRTEDYVPLLPWLGMVLAGFVACRGLLSRQPGLLTGPLPRALVPLARLGRWSLGYYLVHQPVLIGLCMAWRALH